MTEILDVVELTVNRPREGLLAGMQGTVVELYLEGVCEVEFVNEQGETLQTLALPPDQYMVVWRSKDRTWVPIAERVATLAGRMPEMVGRELLDFARFLSAYRQPARDEHQTSYAASSNATVVREANADPYGLGGSGSPTLPDA
jgi:hypothetical protein